MFSSLFWEHGYGYGYGYSNRFLQAQAFLIFVYTLKINYYNLTHPRWQTINKTYKKNLQNDNLDKR